MPSFIEIRNVRKPSVLPNSPLTEGPSNPKGRLYVNDSSNQQGSGAGLVLIAPDHTTIEYTIRFQFKTSYNEAEYEALLFDLRLATKMGDEQIRICSDS